MCHIKYACGYISENPICTLYAKHTNYMHFYTHKREIYENMMPFICNTIMPYFVDLNPYYSIAVIKKHS